MLSVNLHQIYLVLLLAFPYIHKQEYLKYLGTLAHRLLVDFFIY